MPIVSLAKIGIISLALNRELGRHRTIEVHGRKCNVCHLNEIKDEFHFVCTCSVYMHFRAEFVCKQNE